MGRFTYDAETRQTTATINSVAYGTRMGSTK
jgi:hypothetical protein